MFLLPKKWKKSLNYYKHAIELGEKLNTKDQLLDAYQTISDIYERLGDFKNALFSTKKYITLYNESINVDKGMMEAEIKARSRIEQKEAEMEIYASKTAEIREYASRLENINEELRQFAHVASHDLKEPLRMITNYLEIVQSEMADSLGSEIEEYFSYVVGGAKRMDALVNDLRDFVAIDRAAQLDKNLPLNDTAADVLQNLQQLIKEKKAVVTIKDLPVVTANRVQMTQLLQNLLTNALKYSNRSNVKVEVRSEKIESGWKISVKDNGIGIAPHYHKKIFEVFTRLHSVDKYSGTGIGLAICKKIMERHHGKIYLESEEGKGSVFYCEWKGEDLQAVN